MKPITLNRRLTLEDIVRTPDGAGGFAESWAPLGQLWAQVKATTGREAESGNATLSRVFYDITVRSAPFDAPSRPKPEQRFKEGGRVFRILSVAEKDVSGKYLNCTAIEEAVA